MNTRYQYRELDLGDPDLSRNPNDAWIDLGADVERRQQTPWTPRDPELLRQQAEATIEGEAKHLNWWLALGDNYDLPEWPAIAKQLHEAYPFSTVRHPLHYIAQTIVERMVDEEFEELSR